MAVCLSKLCLLLDLIIYNLLEAKHSFRESKKMELGVDDTHFMFVT